MTDTSFYSLYLKKEYSGMKIFIGVLLMVHGLIVTGQAAPGTWIQNPAWLQWWPTALGQSWFLHAFRLERTPWTWLAAVAWLLGGALLVAAGLAIVGIVIPRELWRMLALAGAAVSLTMLLAYGHPFMTLGLLLSTAILVALWANWPPQHIIGA
jgi:hypothetical protein